MALSKRRQVLQQLAMPGTGTGGLKPKVVNPVQPVPDKKKIRKPILAAMDMPPPAPAAAEVQPSTIPDPAKQPGSPIAVLPPPPKSMMELSEIRTASTEPVKEAQIVGAPAGSGGLQVGGKFDMQAELAKRFGRRR